MKIWTRYTFIPFGNFFFYIMAPSTLQFVTPQYRVELSQYIVGNLSPRDFANFYFGYCRSTSVFIIRSVISLPLNFPLLLTSSQKFPNAEITYSYLLTFLQTEPRPRCQANLHIAYLLSCTLSSFIIPFSSH